MKLFISSSAVILIFLLLSCEKENEIKDFQYEATVIGKGIDCGETYIISLRNRQGNSDFIDGIYYADQLESDLKIPGLNILLDCRKPDDNEYYACTTLGPAYPHVVVTDSKINSSIIKD